MAHERLSLDQEHDGTLAPGQAMTDIETALRTRIEEWNAHILGPGLTQWGIDDLAFILAAVVQGMVDVRERTIVDAGLVIAEQARDKIPKVCPVCTCTEMVCPACSGLENKALEVTEQAREIEDYNEARKRATDLVADLRGEIERLRELLRLSGYQV